MRASRVIAVVLVLALVATGTAVAVRQPAAEAASRVYRVKECFDSYAWGRIPLRIGNRKFAKRLDDLPLSAGTKSALRAWAARYDELPRTNLTWSASEDDFEQVGQELWARVSAELGSGWRVGYFSERQGRALWSHAAA